MRKFRILVETNPLFRFSKFSAGDSPQIIIKAPHFFKFHPTRVHRTFNSLRRAKLDLIGSTGNETTTEPIELKIPAVQVFFNSTTGSLNINFTPERNNSRVEMILVDLDGKVVKEITDSTYDNIPQTLYVDISGYKKGIYILQITIDGEKSHQRVVVE
jgi:hypothetical protein